MPELAEQDELKKKVDDLNHTAWELRVSDSGKAMQCCQQAIEFSRKINYKKGLADGLRVEAFGYIRISDLSKATSCLDEADTLYTSIKDIRGLAVINEYRGIIERNRGNSATALEFIFKALEQSQQTAFTENEVTNLYQLGVTYRLLANYDKALDYLYKSLSLARMSGFTLMEGYDLNVIGSIYFETDNYEKALEYYKQGLLIRQQSGDKWGEAGSLDNIGFIYLKLKDYENAIAYCKKSLEITKSTGDKKGQANALLHLAEIYKETNNTTQAIQFSNESLHLRKASGDKRGEAEILLFLASLKQNHEYEDAVNSLMTSLKISEEINANDLVSKIHFYLYEHHKLHGDFNQAIKHLELHIHLEKELHKNTINQKVLNLEISYKAEEAKKDAEAVRLRNEELINLNKEIEQQKKKVEDALAELKATQAQLIQSEKMASLGELTAGIAHEIQNPLNFVNNFSEVNKELLLEMKDEIDKGNINEAKLLADDLIDNHDKINHHGKRADAIVKGMLQHSRSSSAEKEPTDINALVDEYLRLCYHGLRAKDKSFNATIKTDFDNAIGKINIVPQDIGRAILNLLTNAFYAVNEKKNASAGSAGQHYEPTVSISTKKVGDKVLLTVKDNNNGIPQKSLDKIFQPFFTTKPTGQGTGLGLSLSYDIVKAHGGEIKVESKDGEGSEFLIELPFKT